MSLLTYKVLHILGLMLVFSSLGGLLFHSLGGGGTKHRGHKLAGASHGIGLVLVLVSGFGMLANHSLVMANYVSRANAALIDLRKLLVEG